jgi:hypothetical protein
MRNTISIHSTFLILAFSVLGSAQNSITSATSDPPPVKLPKGEDAWAVHVVRSGGLTAVTFKDITIKSTGQMTIDSGQGKRETTVSPAALKMLGQAVLSAKFPKMPNASDDPAGCYDCYTTAMTVRRREPKGKDRTYSGVWVPTTVGSVPEDFVSIVQLVLQIWEQTPQSPNSPK